MSFSFRNLFSQDKSAEASDLAGAGPSTGATAPPPASGTDKGNPFSSAPFSNVFSGAEAPGLPQAAALPKAPSFQPTPLPTNRGSFEALFAGQGLPQPQQPQAAPATVKARYLVREMLPFLPPALVSTDRLPMDRAVEVVVPANGSGEVKLSAIQAACPELFATEITPLNDSEVTLPPAGAAVTGFASGFSVAQPAMPSAREGAASHSIWEAESSPVPGAPGQASNPFAAAPAPSVVTAAAAAAGARHARMDTLGNPFSASPHEVAAPAAGADQGAFGFPETPASASPFGAFGSTPVSASPSPQFVLPSADSGPFASAGPAEKGPANVSQFGGNPAARPVIGQETGPAPAWSPAPEGAASDKEFPWQSKLDPFGGSGAGGSFPGFETHAPKPEKGPERTAATPQEANPFGPENLFGPAEGEQNPFGRSFPNPAPKQKADPDVPGFGSIFDEPVPPAGPTTGGLGGFDFSKLWGPPQDSPVAKPAPTGTGKATSDPASEWPDFSTAGSGASSFFDQGHGAALAGEPFDFSSPWQSSGDSPKPAVPAPSGSGSEKSVLFSLGEILRPIAKAAGIRLASIPPTAKVRLPVSLIEPQLSRGTVSVTIGQLLAHGDAAASTALESVDRHLQVPLPQNELFHQLSDLAPELVPHSDEDLESQFSTLFGTEAMHDAAAGWGETPFPEPPKAAAPQAVTPQIPVASTGTSAKKAPVDLASLAKSARKGSVNPAFADPFAPLPRRKEPPAATPRATESAAPLEDFDTSFFDDLNEFSAAVSAPLAPGELEPEDSAAAESSLPMVPEPPMPTTPAAFPSDSGKSWASPKKASLDELEQTAAPEIKPSPKAPKISVKEQRIPAAPAKKEAAAKPAKPAARPVSATAGKPVIVTTSKPVTVTKTRPEPGEGGFFAELDAAESPAPTPAPAAPVPAPAAPVPAPPQAPPPAPLVAATAAQTPGDQSLRDIELRAVFGTSEPFTFLRVADLTASLPGITAAAIVAPGFTAQSPRNREGGDLAIQASSLILGVREIARLSGMPNAETFTLHTDQGVVSIFLHQDYCLTVRHQTGQFDPGVREKLILVARGLSGLSA